jgi:hypothetical protein
MVLLREPELDVAISFRDFAKVFPVSIHAIDVPIAADEDDRLGVGSELRGEGFRVIGR